MRAASVPDSHKKCLPVQDINVLSRQTFFMTVRFEVRRNGDTRARQRHVSEKQFYMEFSPKIEYNVQ